MKKFVSLLTLLIVCLSASAQAALTWDFRFKTADSIATGHLYTESFSSSTNGYKIIGIDGFYNSTPISGLVANKNYPSYSTQYISTSYIQYDNKLLSTKDFNWYGLYFKAGSVNYNYFTELNKYLMGSSVDLKRRQVTEFSITQQVPDTAYTFALFGSLFMAVSLLRRRR